MKGADIAVVVCLGVCVVTTLICCLGIIVLEDFFDRLHYLAPVTTISSFALLMAVVIKDGWGQAAIKTILVFMVLLLINAVLTHATARAARVREFGHWTAQPKEHIEGAAGEPAAGEHP